MPVITVIVPFYQTAEKVFRPCVESILEDRDADIELLIVDDGSSEEYHSVPDGFLSDERVKVFHRPHAGVSAARNFGVENAAGKWTMFVDSDDKLETGWYSELAPYYERDEDLIIFSGYRDSNGKLFKNRYFVKENTDYGVEEELRYQIMESAMSVGLLPAGNKNYYSLGSPCSKLYKTGFLKNSGIRFDETITFAEDTLFSVNIILCAGSIIYVDKYIYHYVVNTESVTRRYREGISAEMQKFFDALDRFNIGNGIQTRMNDAYLNRAFYEMNRALRLEFLHPDNPKTGIRKRKEVHDFVRREPFRSALRTGMRGGYGSAKAVDSFLIELGMYKTALKLKKIWFKRLNK
ncbi:MAG: glycosyltransferase [Clostridia bacterium]|nr:glycosyltransferase [Clostridia bacterium]